MKKSFILPLCLISLAVPMSACTGPSFRDAQYWQRVDATSALYLQGPKAQQGLHQDISRCSAEINELKRLGSLKKAIPADPDDKSGMGSWDTPERDGYRYAEHLDYTGFESCMRTKGWERVEHLPYDIADEARDNWVDTIRGDRKRLEPKETNIEARERQPYDTLND